jgi:hypothetical protein
VQDQLSKLVTELTARGTYHGFVAQIQAAQREVADTHARVAAQAHGGEQLKSLKQLVATEKAAAEKAHQDSTGGVFF